MINRSPNRNIPSMARPINRRRRTPRLNLNIRLDLVTVLTVVFVILASATLITLVNVLWPKTPSAKASTSAPVEVTQAAPVVSQPMPGGQTKILLLGSDQRPDDPGYRTDVILLITLDTDTMTVSAVSFPRDLWVQVPSLYEMKINQVFALGGFEAMAELFQANFGVTPDYFVMTNFDGFTQFINNRGGIDVEVGESLSDRCDLPQNQGGECLVEPGMVHMDGQTALWYVRSRKTTSDYDRLRRQQEVVYALAKKVLSFGSIVEFPKMIKEVENNIQTNLGVEKAIAFIPLATQVVSDSSRIKRFAIDENQATPTYSWDGMWILLPDTAAIQAVLQEAGVKP